MILKNSLPIWVRSIAISMSVGLSVCPLAYLQTTCPNFTRCYLLHANCGRGLVLLRRQSNMLCTSGLHIMEPVGQNQRRHVSCSNIKRLGCACYTYSLASSFPRKFLLGNMHRIITAFISLNRKRCRIPHR